MSNLEDILLGPVAPSSSGDPLRDAFDAPLTRVPEPRTSPRPGPRPGPGPAGAFHFTPAERDIIRRSGRSDAEINEIERMIGQNEDPERRRMLKEGMLNTARKSVAITEGGLATSVGGGLTEDWATRPVKWGPQHKPWTVGEAVSDMFGMHETTIRGIQDQLLKAGILKAGGYLPGEPDPSTLQAWSMVVQQASMQDMAPHEVLKRWAEKGAEAAEQAFVSRQTFVREPTETVEAGIKGAYQELYGRGPTPEEEAKWMAAFRKRESSYFNQQAAAETKAFNATQSNTAAGPSTIEPPPTSGALVSSALEDTKEAKIFRGASWAYNLVRALESGGTI